MYTIYYIQYNTVHYIQHNIVHIHTYYSIHTDHAQKTAVTTGPNNSTVVPAGRAATGSSAPAAHGRRKNPASYAGHWANYCSPNVGKIKNQRILFIIIYRISTYL